MMNENNILNLRNGAFGRVLQLKQGITVFLPTVRLIANARVLRVKKDGAVSVHWIGNYNLSGDFRTELMQFNSNLVLDTGEVEDRNKERKENGLVEIS